VIAFADLVRCFERLEATSKRLEMFEILAELFRRVQADEVDRIVYLSQGELLPAFRGVEIGISEKLMVRALALAAERSVDEVTARFKATGDLGTAAANLITHRSRGRTVVEIHDAVLALAAMSGEGSVDRKLRALADLFAQVSAEEAKYLARFVVGRLRLGAGDMTVLEALALATEGRAIRPDLERAYNLCSDLGLVARTLLDGGLAAIRRIGIRLGYPIRMARCERLASAEEIVAKIGRCAVEVKYDGFRCQIHKRGETVEIFSRNLERTSAMFPDLVAVTRDCVRARDAIFEGEALAYDEATDQLRPFQETSQRRRKHGVEAMTASVPLKFFAFDLLHVDGQDWVDRPYQERRAELESRLGKSELILPSETITTDDPVALQMFFDASVERGFEGIVAKRLDGPYAAGARDFNWIKLKRSYKGELSDTIDVVIAGYFVGKGQRAQFGVGTVLAAVYDDADERWKTISKVGTGFSEEQLATLHAVLKLDQIPQCPLRLDSLIEPDVWVEPRHVLAVTADEITRSPFHTAGKQGDGPGYALRFPRTKGFLREDKGRNDVTRVAEIARLFELQKRVKLA
jgi:DNA ligase-1